MADQAEHPGTEAGERLAITLAGSLILHFALLFGFQIRAQDSLQARPAVIHARLAKQAIAASVQEEPSPPEEVQLQMDEALASVQPAPPAGEITSVPLPSAAPAEQPADLPGIEIPLIEDPNYYTAQEVDVHPSAIRPVRPLYPQEAAKNGVTGSVVLVLLLDEGGRVKEVSVEEALPPGLFEESAVAAFRHARFTPAQRQGRVVKSRMRIKVNYDLTDGAIPVDRAN